VRRFLDARSEVLHGRDKRSVRRSRWRGRANGASATNESGGEAETRVGSGGVTGWARAAKLAEPERGSHSAVAVVRLKTGTEGNVRLVVGIEQRQHSQLSGILYGVKFSLRAIDLGIVSSQRGEQSREPTIAGDLAQAALSLEHASRGPAQQEASGISCVSS